MTSEAVMTLSRWTPRRLAIIWLAGIALQVVILVVPAIVAMNLTRTMGPRFRREVAAQDAHYTVAERADSISRAKQVSDARATGNFQLRADGQTVYAVVGIPSGRPSQRSIDEIRASMQPLLGVILGLEFGAIPLALIALSLAWLVARKRDDGAAPDGRLA